MSDAKADYAPSKDEKRQRRRRPEKEAKGDSSSAEGDALRAAARAQADVAVLAENLSDKLKILDFDKQFCVAKGFNPISRHYFAFPGNVSDQLHYFSNVMSWLISLTDDHFPPSDQYDDPNEIVSNIVAQLRKTGVHADATQSSLLKGSGEDVCQILNTLAQNALKAQRWQWEKPILPREEFEAETMLDEAIEVTADTAGDEDEIEDEFDDDDDDAFIDVDTVHHGIPVAAESGTSKELLTAEIDVAAWRTEVERVLPQLKVHIRSNNKDWRTHVEQMQQYQTSIEGSMATTQINLDKLHGEISRTLEKIDSREKYVNKQLDSLIKEFRQHHDKLASTQEKYKQAGVSVNEQTRELATLVDELEAVKTEMDERGNSMTDSAPLVKIKQALIGLKSETAEMGLRIGVLQHTLLSAKVRDQKHIANDMNRNPVVSAGWH